MGIYVFGDVFGDTSKIQLENYGNFIAGQRLRFIFGWLCFLGGLLKLPYNIYIIGMDIIGILLLSLSVWVMYKTLLKIMNIKSTLPKIMLGLATYVLIFNQFSLEFLVFPESSVMCLGVFTSVLAATKIITCEKYKYLKIAGLMLVSAFSYQGLINIFFILSIFLIIIKQEFENKNLKETIMPTIKEIIKITIILFTFILNSIMILQNTAEHIAANRVDDALRKNNKICNRKI